MARRPQPGLRRTRVDINRPNPHEFAYAHVEEFIDGHWVRSGPIYPLTYLAGD